MENEIIIYAIVGFGAYALFNKATTSIPNNDTSMIYQDTSVGSAIGSSIGQSIGDIPVGLIGGLWNAGAIPGAYLGDRFGSWLRSEIDYIESWF